MFCWAEDNRFEYCFIDVGGNCITDGQLTSEIRGGDGMVVKLGSSLSRNLIMMSPINPI